MEEQNKPTEKEDQPIEAEQQDKVKFVDVKDFVERIKEAQGTDEVCLLKDERAGLLVQLNSNKVDVGELLSHAVGGFNFLLEKRNKLKIPSMIS